jgi:arsenite methyltransferase
MNTNATNQTHLDVQQYYGETLSSSDDLKTNACCTSASMPAYARQYLAEIHDEVLQRYYGCGLVLPESLEGMSILDLGCGAGRDVYLLARLVGPSGKVVGVDMTTAQLDVARAYQDYHAEKFAYPVANVEFIEANIEQLSETNLAPGSFDLIVSNCVINLAVDKHAVLLAARKLLRKGGEMYFADVYVDRRIPDELRSDPVLYGECLAGAMYPPDFIQLAQAVGFAKPRLVEESPIEILDAGVTQRVGAMRFCSATYRLFNVDNLEAAEEDYGQTATYLGDIPEHPERVELDLQNDFVAGQETSVSSNTARILGAGRFATSFRVMGDTSQHLGAFSRQLANIPDFEGSAESGNSSCC